MRLLIWIQKVLVIKFCFILKKYCNCSNFEYLSHFIFVATILFYFIHVSLMHKILKTSLWPYFRVLKMNPFSSSERDSAPVFPLNLFLKKYYLIFLIDQMKSFFRFSFICCGIQDFCSYGICSFCGSSFYLACRYI